LSPLAFNELRIPLSSVKEGVTEFAFQAEPPVDEAGWGRIFTGKIDVTVRVNRMGDEYLFDLKVKAEGTFVCDRCGEDFQYGVEGRVRTLWTHELDKAGEETDDDVRLLTPSTHEIPLERDVVDALILAIPAKTVCRESCRGLCARCGANLNEKQCDCQKQDTDSRWQGLGELKFE